mmetsp:Transcript_43757/g.109786  ORF Transcript_43757/g.109786 Transcript_43757/m.109786 type:complete len:262 (-) Transcript_43757:1022-1807(-)
MAGPAVAHRGAHLRLLRLHVPRQVEAKQGEPLCQLRVPAARLPDGARQNRQRSPGARCIASASLNSGSGPAPHDTQQRVGHPEVQPLAGVHSRARSPKLRQRHRHAAHRRRRREQRCRGRQRAGVAQRRHLVPEAAERRPRQQPLAAAVERLRHRHVEGRGAVDLMLVTRSQQPRLHPAGRHLFAGGAAEPLGRQAPADGVVLKGGDMADAALRGAQRHQRRAVPEDRAARRDVGRAVAGLHACRGLPHGCGKRLPGGALP